MELFARRKMSETGFIAQTHFEDIKGNSDRLKDVKAMAQVYAQSDVNILIYGESGTGKEVFAQSIHNHSNFKDGPFVAVNCTALTDTLMESELFGYEDGAFTGAKKGGKPGLFEMAHGGTLFLDEIGDMPLALQVKLLRVLQERNVRRVGGSKSLPLNIRCIFATNQNLAHAVQEKRFREDLYYRINVLSLHIPPLRERAQDIPILAKDIAAKASARMGRSYFFPKDCADLLQRYSWPGNVRELTNFMERVIVLKARDRKTIEQMIAELLPARELPRETGFDAPLPDEEHLCVRIDSLRRMEDEIIQALLQKYGGDKKRVEWVLGVSSTTLWRRFKAMEQNGGR